MRLLALLLFGLCFPSCSAMGLVDCEGHFIYDTDDFTAEEKGWIEHGAVRWNAWVGRNVVNVRDGKANTCVIHDGTTKSPKAIGQDHERTSSITIDIEHMRRIKILDQKHFEAVVMHEVGHALGFHHVGASGKALMASEGAPDFTDIDRVECIELGICTTLK